MRQTNCHRPAFSIEVTGSSRLQEQTQCRGRRPCNGTGWRIPGSNSQSRCMDEKRNRAVRTTTIRTTPSGPSSDKKFIETSKKVGGKTEKQLHRVRRSRLRLAGPVVLREPCEAAEGLTHGASGSNSRTAHDNKRARPQRPERYDEICRAQSKTRLQNKPRPLR